MKLEQNTEGPALEPEREAEGPALEQGPETQRLPAGQEIWRPRAGQETWRPKQIRKLGGHGQGLIVWMTVFVFIYSFIAIKLIPTPGSHMCSVSP